MWPVFYKHENLQTTIPFGNIAILGGGGGPILGGGVIFKKFW